MVVGVGVVVVVVEAVVVVGAGVVTSAAGHDATHEFGCLHCCELTGSHIAGCDMAGPAGVSPEITIVRNRMLGFFRNINPIQSSMQP